MDLTTTILLVLIGIIIGFLLNALLTSLRKGPDVDTGAQVSPPASTQAPKASPAQVSSDEPEVPNLNPFKIFSRVFQPVGKATGETGSESIVAQIDALLQSRLEGTHLAERGVRLVETPGQGMSVLVGLENFATIESIPDPEVQTAIRQAVTEWEARLEK